MSTAYFIHSVREDIYIYMTVAPVYIYVDMLCVRFFLFILLVVCKKKILSLIFK